MAAPSKPKSSSGSPKSSSSHGAVGGTGILAASVGIVVAGILLCNPFTCAATVAGVGVGALALGGGAK